MIHIELLFDEKFNNILFLYSKLWLQVENSLQAMILEKWLDKHEFWLNLQLN